ncbi:NUDIX hydrolase [Pseudogemmobacter sonorensis]|uniref:NUDIX hydrolase n=1 Tax=Pseudogemmobacter sonorensis TaxID=2989681 RepID=UPI0036960629
MSSGYAQAELIAVMAAVTGAEPRVMTVAAGRALPSGPFTSSHRSLQQGLRAWIETQTGHPVGFLEQLYTFADRDRDPAGGGGTEDLRRISISYLGLVHEQAAPGAEQPEWHGWYEYFPWEDRREDRREDGAALEPLVAALRDWAGRDPARRSRLDHAFGLGGDWQEDLVLQRYELMYEAGLVAEARRDGSGAGFGRAMRGDHRRILATGIARLRAKIRYRPVAFELMPESFTLLHLQRTVEALAGLNLHKSNFRRQIDQQELIEDTGAMTAETRGRPAKLFRYRPALREARALAGTRLPFSRN